MECTTFTSTPTWFRRIFIAPSRIDRHTHHTTYRAFVGIGGLPAGEPAPPNTANMLAVELMDPRRSWELPRPSIDSPALESSRVRKIISQEKYYKNKIPGTKLFCSESYVPSGWRTLTLQGSMHWLVYICGKTPVALRGIYVCRGPHFTQNIRRSLSRTTCCCIPNRRRTCVLTTWVVTFLPPSISPTNVGPSTWTNPPPPSYFF